MITEPRVHGSTMADNNTVNQTYRNDDTSSHVSRTSANDRTHNVSSHNHIDMLDKSLFSSPPIRVCFPMKLDEHN